MAIIAYTSYDEVRAVLGVSSDELEDATLGLSIYADNLQAEFQDLSASLITDYTTIAAKDSSSRTSDEQWFYQVTRLFAAYAVARQLSTSLALFGPKDISDGKATMGRFADSPYKEVIKRVSSDYERARVRLEKAYAAVKSSALNTTTRIFLGVASPSSDPVTGS